MQGKERTFTPYFLFESDIISSGVAGVAFPFAFIKTVSL